MGGKWYKKQEERKRSIDSTTANGLFSIFNSCYKGGVKDAEYVSDADLCCEFAATVREPGVFGRVIYTHTMTPMEWRCHIPIINPRCVIRRTGIKYLFSLNHYMTFFSCALPVAQEFYLQGVEDYNSHPTIHDFAMFDNNRMQRWTKSGIVPRSRQDMMTDMQNFCFERGRNDEGYKGHKYAMSSQRYGWFAQAVWGAMQGTWKL